MSVLSHLTHRFSTQPENLATEALAYVLNASQPARDGVARLVEHLCGRKLQFARFDAQVENADRSRPDLVGVDPAGLRPLMLEVKFWAGLTDAQPNGYLAALSPPGVLLFVAPEARLASLWGELCRRVLVSGVSCEVAGSTITVGGNVVVAVSWRVLLKFIETEAEAAHETHVVADVRQLNSLCEKMDTEAFLPLTSEELTSNLGRRVLQFEALTNDLTDHLVRLGVADVRGLRATAAWGCCGRYLRLRGNGAFLKFDANHWARWGQSPLWLDIGGNAWKQVTPIPTIRAALAGMDATYWELGGACCVPILLPTGQEKDGVIAAALAQLQAIAQALPEAQSADAEGV